MAALLTFGTSILNYCAKIAQQVLPGICLLCGAKASPSNLCAGCTRDLPHLAVARCPRCAIPTLDGAVCGACLANPPAFDAAIAACAYAYPLDRLVHAYKFRGNLAIAPILTDLMLPIIRAHSLPDVIIPVPLSEERLRERGFNQSQEIARLLARCLRRPMDADSCSRVRHAPAQSTLAFNERAQNVRGAFVCLTDFSQQRVAIVDDVLTTGATLGELARVLRKCGASEIVAWVAARTV